MSPTPRRRRPSPPPEPFPEKGLAELGLAAGDAVRFRRTDAERWKPATVARRERDGSVGLHDVKGASRAIPIGCIEVRDTGPRGGVVWEPLAVRAARTEQLALVRSPDQPTESPADQPVPAGSAWSTPSGATPPGTTPTPTSPSNAPPTTPPDAGPDDGQLRLL